MTKQKTAKELFQAAYENRYTWDKNFPGYRADVKLTRGDSLFQGQVQVNANLTTEVFGIDDQEANDLVKNQLWEIAIHRVRRAFEETHGKNTFEYGETDQTGAIEILVGGKASGDKYKVHNNEVCMVHRKIHDTVVTINTFSSHDTGSGYLSHQYDSFYSDVTTGMAKSGKTVFTDSYEQIGDYFIMNSRTIESKDSGTSEQIQYSSIYLLSVKEFANLISSI